MKVDGTDGAQRRPDSDPVGQQYGDSAVTTITEHDQEEDDPARVMEMRKAVCRFLIRLDKQMDRLVGKPYSAPPYWAFLLELYLAEAEDMPTFQSCLSAGEPASNAHRRSARLAEMGVIDREADPADHRRVVLRLTPMMKRALDRVLDATFAAPAAMPGARPGSVESYLKDDSIHEARMQYHLTDGTNERISDMAVVRGKVIAGGRIALPADIRRSLGLQNGDTVLFEVAGDEVRIRSARTALRRVQERLRTFAPREGLVSDELMVERRAEATRA